LDIISCLIWQWKRIPNASCGMLQNIFTINPHFLTFIINVLYKAHNNFTKLQSAELGKGMTNHLYLTNNEHIQNFKKKYSYTTDDHQLSYESERML
jgi:hypothetical protein